MEDKNALNSHVGRKIRQLREELGMGREVLAEKIESTPELVQAYEAGTLHVSAATLYAIAGVLGAPIDEFFR